MTEVQASLTSPGVGARRKGPKTLPRLPPSAFTPPTSSASEQFPLPQSPSTAHPTVVVDSNLSIAALQDLKTDVGLTAPRDVTGIVLALSADSQPAAVDQILQSHPSLKILSVLLPANLDQGPLTNVPTFRADVPVSLSVPFVKNSPKLVEGVKWALEQGYVVDINVQALLKETGEGWEGLEELLSAVLGSGEDSSKATPRGIIVLSNILPPPLDLNISIVKLLSHSTYRTYQTSMASLSLFPSVYVKYIPPPWGSLPQTPDDGGASSEDSKEKKAWKRRITMYLGPTVEAFGYQRILYGSSIAVPGGDSNDWYELARESLVGIGVDQEGLDAVFGTNASAVYGA